MKKNIILSVCLASLFMTACKEWLTVYPEDEVAAGELFENGEGYRTALNGIYQQLSEEPLYGKNLTYGVVEAMGQVYDKEYFGASNYAMEYASDLKYDNLVSTIDEVWSGMYNSIANCNNLIQHIEQADSNMFEYKHQEKTMIQGEAYALRGFLHFDLLRLFAPAVAVEPVDGDPGNAPDHIELPDVVWVDLHVQGAVERGEPELGLELALVAVLADVVPALAHPRDHAAVDGYVVGELEDPAVLVVLLLQVVYALLGQLDALPAGPEVADDVLLVQKFQDPLGGGLLTHLESLPQLPGRYGDVVVHRP